MRLAISIRIRLAFVVALYYMLGSCSFFKQSPPDHDAAMYTSRIETYRAALPKEKIYLHFDRPMYKPGEDIWFKAYLVDAATNQPTTQSEVLYVELINPKGAVVNTLAIPAINGSGRGDFRLDSNTGGLYKIRAYTEWMKNFADSAVFEKELQVQAVVLPRLRMSLEFERKTYGASDRVVALLNLQDLENQPLTHRNFKVAVSLEGKEIFRGSGQTDGNGDAKLNFQLPADLKTTDGLVNVMIQHEGNAESISRSIPIVLNRVDLQFLPEGGSMVADVQGRVGFKALNESGKPADVSGEVLDNRGKVVARFSSFHQGMGAFEFTPAPGQHYRAKITKPEGITRLYELPEVQPDGYALRVEPAEAGFLMAKVTSKATAKTVLVVQVSGRSYFSKTLKLARGENHVRIPLETFPAGVAQVSLFDSKNTLQCERLAFVNKHRLLNVKISTDKEKYQPREKVQLTVRTTDENGKPVPARLSLAVADDKLLSFANDKQDNILSYLLLSSEVKGKVDEPAFYFKKDEVRADRALDYLLMTQGWRHAVWQEVLTPYKAGYTTKFAAEKAIVRGRVIDPKTGKPLPCLRVWAESDTIITDTLGRFELRHVDLSKPFRVFAANGEHHTSAYEIEDYATEFVSGGKITGKIRDAKTKKPLKDVVVTDDFTTVRTNHKGEYEIQVNDSRGQLWMTKDGYVDKRFTADDSTRIDLDMEPVFEGRVSYDLVVDMYKIVANSTISDSYAYSANINCGLFDQAAGYYSTPAVIREMEDAAIAAMETSTNPMEMMTYDGLYRQDIQADTTYLPSAKRRWMQNYYVRQNDLNRLVRGFPGGTYEMAQFIEKNLRLPVHLDSSYRYGHVKVSFVVNTDGKLSDIRTESKMGKVFEKEAGRIVGLMPAWETDAEEPVHSWISIYFGSGQSSAPKFFEETNADIQFSGKGRQEKNHPYRAREFYAPTYSSSEENQKRNDFRSTIYWNPEITTGKEGSAVVEFYNSDEVTTFRATAEGIGGGLIGRGETTYFTQLPFSISTKLPVVLAFGDHVTVPVTLTNNKLSSIAGLLKVEIPKGMTLLSSIDEETEVAGNSTRTVYLEFEVTDKFIGRQNLHICFKSSNFTDIVEQPLEIRPKGFPVKLSFSGNKAESRYSFVVGKPAGSSLKASLKAYPNILSQLQDGLASILAEPHGCFEQTSATTYPNVLVLQYLEKSGLDEPELRKKALDFIGDGYRKLVAFETPEQGFEWFGAAPGHEGLTAYGLMEFVDMQKVYSGVDPAMIQRTLNWLLSRRDGKGGFKLSGGKYGFEEKNQFVSNAYITYALSEAGYRDIGREVDAAYREAVKSRDAYRAALVANTCFNLGQKEKALALLDLIVRKVKEEGFSGLYSQTSITFSGGKSLKAETTALLLTAMLHNLSIYEIQVTEAINYLTSMCSEGGFGSTQATILTLKAFTRYADTKGERSGQIEVVINGQPTITRDYDGRSDVSIDSLAMFLSEGKQEIVVKCNGKPIPHSLTVKWATSTPPQKSGCEVNLQTSLGSSAVQAGETVRLNAVLKNVSKRGLPMTMAVVGIPSGLSLQPWQLKELKEQNKVDFYEVYDNYVAFYFRALAPDAVHQLALDLKADIPGAYEAPASCAYLYYTPELKSWAGGATITIHKSEQENQGWWSSLFGSVFRWLGFAA